VSTSSPEITPNWVLRVARCGRILVSLPLFVSASCALIVDQPTSGIRGTMFSGPTCPVVGPDTGNECDDQPYAGTVIVRTENGGREVARFTADEDGVFETTLNPGTYLLVPQPGVNGFPFAENQLVQVSSDVFTDVTILYDTGIR
jgi:hypothetical protein